MDGVKKVEAILIISVITAIALFVDVAVQAIIAVFVDDVAVKGLPGTTLCLILMAIIAIEDWRSNGLDSAKQVMRRILFFCFIYTYIGLCLDFYAPTDGDDWKRRIMIRFASLTIYDFLKDFNDSED